MKRIRGIVALLLAFVLSGCLPGAPAMSPSLSSDDTILCVDNTREMSVEVNLYRHNTQGKVIMPFNLRPFEDQCRILSLPSGRYMGTVDGMAVDEVMPPAWERIYRDRVFIMLRVGQDGNTPFAQSSIVR